MSDSKSIFDIAKKANVSIATVSRVINGQKGYSEKTKQKVMDAVKECGYRPNANAVRLRTCKSFCIGVLVPDITNEFFAKIVRELENFFIGLKYTLIICDSNEDIEKENLQINKLLNLDIDGIIYISGQEQLGNIKKISSIPVVYIDRRPQNANVLIRSDNERGGYLAVRELINDGCKKIIIARDPRNVSTIIERKNGYLRALSESAIPFNADMEVICRPDYDSAKKMIENLISEQGCYFDGIFCTCDMMALGVLNGLTDMQYKVPEDVKIVGFDNISISKFCSPPMTTVSQDTKLIAQNAGRVLLKEIETGVPAQTEIKIPVELKVRKTTSKK
ncbi:MAG: LacI family transcriptional regulator [Treponema sp.]|jgi:LacI family transcriptional regulator|nr:LacI family transcriptional regulator [Treponema sp.]